jgi:Predicted ATP-binding protein involved in virulence
MRIREISVSRLFGTFDHVIPMNPEEHITIIYGPNGFGKTAILRMLEGLLKLRWTVFRATPFARFRVTFDNLAELEIVRSEAPKPTRRRANAPSVGLTLRLVRPNSETKEASIQATSPRLHPVVAERYLSPFLTRIGPAQWAVDETHEIIGTEEVIERYGHVLPPDSVEAKAYPWATEFLSDVNLLFIQTQRLQDGGRHASADRFRRGPYPTPGSASDLDQAPAVIRHSDEIKRDIELTLATFAARSQELDSSFPARLFQQTRAASLQLGDLRDRLARLENRRAELTKLGFLAPEPDSNRALPQIDEEKREALSVYVLDNEQKLAVFDSLASKIQLLTDTINKRFQYKRMSISKDRGFVFTSLVDGSDLSLTSLSSGEQHEIVLLYELLFRVQPKSVILVDEPEISLHLAWQQQFIADLQQMATLSAFDALVATHSPAIIGRRLDLAVELKGPPIPSNDA